MVSPFIIPSNLNPSKELLDKVEEFASYFNPYEVHNGAKLVLFHDEKSLSYYLVCHLMAQTLVAKCDLEAALDADEEDEIYKLNRDFTEDPVAYKIMEADALHGRSFEDMVVEYDTSYRKSKPLKVYGGQHRIHAIQKALDTKGSTVHGIRVYFGLSREQKVEIATVNNTSISVPNDLLDRMQEQLMGSELRVWCQTVGLLASDEDFADKKSLDSPTVRIARTLIVNFYKGMNSSADDFLQPIVCTSGGHDAVYNEQRGSINWADPKLINMGKEYARLHYAQKETVRKRNQDNNAEFARKALSLAVVASWGYAAGYFQNDPASLQNLYKLPDSVSAPDDPLNAKALSQARLKGTDPDTYRGLGARTSPPELGRMLEVFLIYAKKANKKRITKELVSTGIEY